MMKSEDEVIRDAIPIIENQWCKESWKMTKADSISRGLPPKAHYCAMGAVEKAVGMSRFGELDHLAGGYEHKPGRTKFDVVDVVSSRLARSIRTLFPEWVAVNDNFCGKYADASMVEYFNDDEETSREDMIEVFKHALPGEVPDKVELEVEHVEAPAAFPGNKVLTDLVLSVVE